MRFSIILFLAICAALAVLLTLSAVNAQEKEENLQEEELESLRRAWKKHEEEKREENPSDSSSEEQGTLEAIAGKMRMAERRLSEEDTGAETQKKELEAINLLNQLIREAQKQLPQESPDQNKSNPPQPAPGSEQKLTEPGRLNPAQPESERQKSLIQKTDKKEDLTETSRGGAMSKIWGHLRPCDRKEALSASEEEFPQKYKKLLEIYYGGLLKR